MKLSKLNERRLNNFKNNKRGYYSFWVFSSVLSSGIGERYIGILEIIPDELPYSILFLYMFYLSEKNIFIKAIKLFFLL